MCVECGVCLKGKGPWILLYTQESHKRCSLLKWKRERERNEGGEEIYKHSGSFMLSINNRLVFSFNGAHNGRERHAC